MSVSNILLNDLKLRNCSIKLRNCSIKNQIKNPRHSSISTNPLKFNDLIFFIFFHGFALWTQDI